jgi:hypothetical protein
VSLEQVSYSDFTRSLPFSAVTHAAAGNYQYPPQSAQNKATQGEANFIDGSGPIFSMYMEMATEEDKKMAEGWKADADGILIFVRHYLSILCTTSLSHRPVYSLLLLPR